MIPDLALCPGKLLACEGIQSKDSVQSTAGTAGHAALEQYYNQHGYMPVEAFTGTLDDMTASRCHWYAKTIDELIASHGGALSIQTELHLKRMLWEGVELSGHIDLLVRCNDGIDMIVDYKFNFLEVTRASQNLQLMAYGILWQPQAREEIHTILTAGGNEEPFTATPWGAGTLFAAFNEMVKICWPAMKIDAPRCPSDACRYCPAKCSSRCPETMDIIKNAVVPARTYIPMSIEEEITDYLTYILNVSPNTIDKVLGVYHDYAQKIKL